jgi:anti-sigma regulatory factor (Ser/Thr protein kinase)
MSASTNVTAHDDAASAAVSADSPESPEQCVRRQPALRSGVVISWRQVFAGIESQVRELRRWLTGLLPDCAEQADVICVAGELAANAIRHTSSGREGGHFAAELTWYGPIVRVAVADGGGPKQPRVLSEPYSGRDGYDEYGRGLRMVEALTVRNGVAGDAHGRVVWAEVLWPEEPAPLSVDCGPLQEEMADTGDCSLRWRLSEFLAWFERETRQDDDHSDRSRTVPAPPRSGCTPRLRRPIRRTSVATEVDQRRDEVAAHRRGALPHP